MGAGAAARGQMVLVRKAAMVRRPPATAVGEVVVTGAVRRAAMLLPAPTVPRAATIPAALVVVRAALSGRLTGEAAPTVAEAAGLTPWLRPMAGWAATVLISTARVDLAGVAGRSRQQLLPA